MDFILWCLNLAWKILAICMGFMLLKYVLRNGSDTFREILDTIAALMKTLGHAIRKACLNYLRKEERAAETKTDESDVQEISQEEFERKLREHESFVL